MFEKLLMATTKFYKRPVLVVTITIAITIFLGLGIPQIQFDNDVRSMLPEGNNDVAVNNYYENEDVFGNSNLIFIGIESKDAFSVESLSYLKNSEKEIDALNQTLPVKNLSRVFAVSTEEATTLQAALGQLGWNAQSAAEVLNPLLVDPQTLAKGLSIDPALAAKIFEKMKKLPAVDVYRYWEAPIASIQSLTDADFIVNEDDTLKVKKLLEGDEITPEAIATLKQRIQSWELYQNALVSNDGTMAALMVRLSNPSKSVQTSVDNAIAEILKKNSHEGIKTYLDGESVIADQIGILMFSDMSLLMPLVLIVVLGILFLSFKRWEGVVYPSIVIAISVVWAVGMMAWLKVPMNVVSVAMPVLLVAISSAYAIHQMNHYFLDPETDRMKVLIQNMKSVGLAVTLSGITVMVGFGALIIEKFVPIRNFGIFTAVGDLFAVMAALVVLPALLLIGHKPKNVVIHEPEKGWVGKLLQSFSSLTKKHPVPIIVVSALLTLGFATGIFFVKSELNNVSFFKEDTPIRQADDKLNEKLAGTQLLNVVIDSDLTPVLDRGKKLAEGEQAPEIRELTRVSVLKKIDAFSGEVKKRFPFVTKVLSFNDLLKKMNQEMQGGSPEQYRIPDQDQLISQYLLIFSGDTKSMLSANHDKLRISLSLRRTTGEEVEKVRQFALEYFGQDFQNTEKVQVQVTGTAHLYYVANDLLVHGNIESLLICLIVVFLLLLLVLRSFWMSLIALLPIFVTLAVNFGVLGFFGIPLNSGTAMVSSIAIGIGVDYSIHYVTWYRNELRKGHSVDMAVSMSILHKGRAILYNMFVIFGGFVVLAASQFVPLVQFGLLVSLCMLTTAFGALIVVPAVIHLLAKFDLKFLQLGVKK